MSTPTAAPGLEQIVSLLSGISFLEGLPRPDLEKVVRLMRGRTLSPGELLFRENDPADRLYLVHAGSLEILKERPRGDHERLAIKRVGDTLGELSLLSESAHGNTARALEPTRLLVISRDQFLTLLGGDSLSVRMLRSLARSVRAVGRLGAGEASAPSVEQVRAFNRALHDDMVPRHLPLVDGYDVAGGIAQDEDGNRQAIWCTTPLQSGGALFAVLDVKGASLPSAHLLAIARALLTEIAGRENNAGSIMARLNASIARAIYDGLDACIEAAVLVLNHTGVSISIAGDDPAVIVRDSGTLEEISQSGPALGIVPRFEYATHSCTLQQGEAAILFSESDRGLVRGAADLVSRRKLQSAAQVAGVLEHALVRAQSYRKGNDLAFILIKRL